MPLDIARQRGMFFEHLLRTIFAKDALSGLVYFHDFGHWMRLGNRNQLCTMLIHFGKYLINHSRKIKDVVGVFRIAVQD